MELDSIMDRNDKIKAYSNVVQGNVIELINKELKALSDIFEKPEEQVTIVVNGLLKSIVATLFSCEMSTEQVIYFFQEYTEKLKNKEFLIND